MAEHTIKPAALPGAELVSLVPRVALRFRKGYAPDKLSEREIDALCPVLPELASELVMLMAAENDKE